MYIPAPKAFAKKNNNYNYIKLSKNIIKTPTDPPASGPSDLDTKQYDPPLFIFPLVAIALSESAVSNVIAQLITTIIVVYPIPASPEKKTVIYFNFVYL